jgi:hypothetical protein
MRKVLSDDAFTSFFQNKGAVAGTFTAVALAAIFLGWVAFSFIVKQRRRARRRAHSTFIQHKPADDLEHYEKEKGFGVEMSPSRPDMPEPSADGHDAAGVAVGHVSDEDHATALAPAGAYPDREVHYGTNATAYGQYDAHGQQAYGAPVPHAQGHQAQPSQDYADAYADAYTDAAQYGATGQHGYDQQQYGAQQYNQQQYGQQYAGQQQQYAVDYPPMDGAYPAGTAYANAQRQEGSYQYEGSRPAYGSDTAMAQAHAQAYQHAYAAPGVSYGTAR